MVARRSDAEWKGSLKEGSGTVSLGSGAFSGAYSFASRFENGTGTNPEELLGAAHAGCFSMALSMVLGAAGFTPRSVKTSAVVHIEPTDDGFGISRIDLATQGDVPGIDLAAFTAHAEAAKKGCPLSKALAAVEITLDARLVGS